jgi:hypothetical protein
VTRTTVYMVDPVKRTYHPAAAAGASNGIAAQVFNGEGRVALPSGKVCFQQAPPVAGASGAERLQAVNAEVSQDLGIVTMSHRSDTIGTVDYRVTNIRRAEPRAALFELPTDYTLVMGSHEDPVITFAAWQLHRCVPGTR